MEQEHGQKEEVETRLERLMSVDMWRIGKKRIREENPEGSQTYQWDV